MNDALPRKRLAGVLRPIAAIRAPFLLASLLPVLLGLAAVRADGIDLEPGLAILTLLAVGLLHAGINVINDVIDARNGTDEINVDRISPFTGGSRMIQNGVYTERELARLAVWLFALAALIGVWLVVQSGIGVLALGVFGFLLGWGYSAPPLALNRRGFGELAVLSGFALLPATAWVVQTGRFDVEAFVLGLPGGLLIAALLYVNQFPDRVADAAVGKRHWVVRLGTAKARWGYLVLVVMGWSVAAAVLLYRSLGVWPAVPAVLSLAAVVTLVRHHAEPSRLRPAIVCTLAASLLHVALLAIVLWSSGPSGP